MRSSRWTSYSRFSSSRMTCEGGNRLDQVRRITRLDQAAAGGADPSPGPRPAPRSRPRRLRGGWPACSRAKLSTPDRWLTNVSISASVMGASSRSGRSSRRDQGAARPARPCAGPPGGRADRSAPSRGWGTPAAAPSPPGRRGRGARPTARRRFATSVGCSPRCRASANIVLAVRIASSKRRPATSARNRTWSAAARTWSGPSSAGNVSMPPSWTATGGPASRAVSSRAAQSACRSADAAVLARACPPAARPAASPGSGRARRRPPCRRRRSAAP